jgi:hypothetical protein
MKPVKVGQGPVWAVAPLIIIIIIIIIIKTKNPSNRFAQVKSSPSGRSGDTVHLFVCRYHHTPPSCLNTTVVGRNISSFNSTPPIRLHGY